MNRPRRKPDPTPSMHPSRTARLLLPALALLVVTQLLPAGTSSPKQVSPPKNAAEPAPDRWTFQLEPYLWATGLDGTTGVNGFNVGFSVGFDSILDHLEMAFAQQFEARRGRWGILADGFYAKLGGGQSPPGPFYSNVEGEVEQFLAELAVAYRIAEGPRGFVDLIAGGRLNALSVDITAEISSSGVRSFSEAATRRLADEIAAQARAAATARLPELKAAINASLEAKKEQIREDFLAQLGSRFPRPEPLLDRDLRGMDGLLSPGLTARDRRTILRGIDGEFRELVEALVAERLAAAETGITKAKSGLKARAQQRAAQARSRIAKATTKFEKALARELSDRLPTGAGTDEVWIDPFVGARAQWNFTEKLFLAARGDVGGFVVGSDIAYQLQATLGYEFTERMFTEVGYRYLKTEYENGGFLYDVAQAGAFIGFGFRF